MSGEGRTFKISAHLKARTMTARRGRVAARGIDGGAGWAVKPGEANDATAQSIPGQRQTGGAMLRRHGATESRVGYVRCVDGMCDGSRGLRSGRGMHVRGLWGRDWSRCGRCVRGGRGSGGDLRGVRGVCGKGQGLCVNRRARGEATAGSQARSWDASQGTRGTVGARLVWAKPAEFGGYGGVTVRTRRDAPRCSYLASATASSHDG